MKWYIYLNYRVPIRDVTGKRVQACDVSATCTAYTVTLTALSLGFFQISDLSTVHTVSPEGESQGKDYKSFRGECRKDSVRTCDPVLYCPNSIAAENLLSTICDECHGLSDHGPVPVPANAMLYVIISMSFCHYLFQQVF